LIEVGLLDWTVERDGTARSSTLVTGDFLVRYGLDDLSEFQVGWTAFGRVREHDRASAQSETRSGTGDLAFAYKRSLSNPDGSGLSVAVQPFATIPLGSVAVGAGQWEGGLLLPASVDVGSSFQIQVTPEVDYSGDDDRHGHHLAYGGVAGFSVAIAEEVSSSLELAAFRDSDPSGHFTDLRVSGSIGLQLSNDLQVDGGVVAGLNRQSPDVEIYLGLSRRF